LDPTYEIGVAAPMSGVRLILLRTLTVIVTTTPLLIIAALFVPGGGWVAFGWVLPSFALIMITLALSTFTSPERAGVAVGVGWIVALIVLIDRDGAGDFVEKSLIFGPAGQTAVAVVAAIGLIIAASRKTCFDAMNLSGGRR
jgi:hypothetical protein